MSNNMVVNTKFTPNDNLKLGGNGIYDDIESNIIDIASRAIDANEMIGSDYKNIQHLVKCSPEFVDFQSSPVLFCWCSGSDFEYNEMGGNSGKNMHGHESFYCHVYYGVTGRDALQMHLNVRAVASTLSEALINNLNLNDLMDGFSEFVSTEFAAKLMRFNKQLVPMNGVHFKVIYRRGVSTHVYSNPSIENF